MAAEEHGLPPVIAESIAPRARQIAAFWVVRAHTRLVILQSAVLEERVKKRAKFENPRWPQKFGAKIRNSKWWRFSSV